MEISLLFSFLIFIGIYSFHFSKAKEPVCSKFAYEEQLLEKMIRTEIKVEMMVNEIKTTQDNVLSTLEDIKETIADFSDLRENITEEMIKKGDAMKQREEIFQTLFEEMKTNLTSVVVDKRKAPSEIQGNLSRPPIAFYAHHVRDVYLDSTDEIIIFGKTFINEGAGYDTSTGIFRAPVGGLYQFVVHICAMTNKYTFAGLVLEGRVVAKNSNYDKDYATCNTFGAIVRVTLGEKVWVKSTSSSSNRQLLEDSYRMNTFSGLLVNN